MASRGASIASTHIDAELDDSGLERQAKAAGDKAGKGIAKSLSDSIKKGFTGEQLGKGIVQGLGIAGALGAANLAANAIGSVKDAIGGAVSSAIDFEQGLRNVNSIAKVTDDELDNIGEAALEIGGKFGQSANTMVDALYDINSSGFAGADALEVLEASALAATAGMATTGEAASGITAVLNAYGMEAEDAGHVSDVLFKTVERGVVTFPELSAAIGTTTALAAPLGVSLEEVGAALAVMTRAGIDAENATTQLNAIMASMLKPSTEATELAQDLGIEWSAAGLKANGLTGQLNKMIKATGGSEEQMAILLGDARAIRGAFSLAAEGGAELNDELAIMEEAAGAAADAFSEQRKGTAFQLAVANAKLEEAGIRIGQDLLPMLASLAVFVVDEVIPAIQAFGEVVAFLTGNLEEAEHPMADILSLIIGMPQPIEHAAEENERLGVAVDKTAEKFEKMEGKFTPAVDAIAHSARHQLPAATGAFQDTGAAAEEMGKAAERGARDFRTAIASTLTALAELRAGITGDAGAAAAALYDPLIAQLDLIDMEEELRANKKALRDKSITDAEKRELERRNAELNKSLLEQNALILTYGTEAEQISKTKAFLASDFWVQAYKDATPEQAAALDQWKLTLQGRLDAMEGSAKQGGADVRDGFTGELRQGGPGVGSALGTWDKAADEAFRKQQKNALYWGKSTGAAYAQGLRSSYGLVNDAAYYVGRAVGALKPSSPPPAIPWIIDAGYELGEMWAEGIAKAVGRVRTATATLAGGAAGLQRLPSYAASGAFSAPTRGALPMPSAQWLSAPAPVGGRQTTNIVNVTGLVKARDPFEIAEQLQRFQSVGNTAVFADDEPR